MSYGHDAITIETPSGQACECSDCDWRGMSDDLEGADGAALNAGDPSPAGRCPECDSLAYLVEDYTTRAVAEACAVWAMAWRGLVKLRGNCGGSPAEQIAINGLEALAAASVPSVQESTPAPVVDFRLHGVDVRHDSMGYYVCTNEEAESEDRGAPSAGFDGRIHYVSVSEASLAAVKRILQEGL